MKLRTVYSLFALIALAPACALAGTVIVGKSIDFTLSDFTAGSAKKSWVVNDNTINTPDTEIWAWQGSVHGGNNGLANNTQILNPHITWKFTVPSAATITGFDWAVKRLLLNGPIGTTDLTYKFTWSYSTDGTTWTPFFNRDNRASTDTGVITLSNQVYTQSIVGSDIQTLYIRASDTTVGAPATGNKSGYFAVASANAAIGGEDVNSYIVLRTAPSSIPEPASMALLAGILGLACVVMARRTHHLNADSK